jgi:hypothetical protein
MSKKNVKINVTISEDLDEKFRETVSKTLGFRKGNLQIAIEEALEMWIDKKAREQKEKK